jgi:hypothetical protein
VLTQNISPFSKVLPIVIADLIESAGSGTAAALQAQLDEKHAPTKAADVPWG